MWQQAGEEFGIKQRTLSWSKVPAYRLASHQGQDRRSCLVHAWRTSVSANQDEIVEQAGLLHDRRLHTCPCTVNATSFDTMSCGYAPMPVSVVQRWLVLLLLRAVVTTTTTTPFLSTASLAPITSNYTVAPNELLATLALRGIKVADLLSRFDNDLFDGTALLRNALMNGLSDSRLDSHLEDAKLAIVALDLDQTDGVDVTLTLRPVNTSELSCAMRDYVDNGHAKDDLQRVVSTLSRDTITSLDLLELRSCATCPLPTNCSFLWPTTTSGPIVEPLVDEDDRAKPSKVMIAIVASVGSLVLIVLIVTAVRHCRQAPASLNDAAPSFTNPACKSASNQHPGCCGLCATGAGCCMHACLLVLASRLQHLVI